MKKPASPLHGGLAGWQPFVFFLLGRSPNQTTSLVKSDLGTRRSKLVEPAR